MAFTDIQKVRVEIGDTDPGFPLLDDATYDYYLQKHNNSIVRASIDAAKTILFQLSMQDSHTVDIFSVRNTSAASYKQALMLYIKDPNLNPLYNNLNMWVGGVSKTEIAANNANVDNKYIQSLSTSSTTESTDGFSI